MNKVRPGAYINFESVPKPLSSIGSRGIVTFPASLSWGPQGEIIELYSTDLIDGRSLAKVGVTAFDAESLLFRQALSGAYLAYIYRVDTGGTKATGTLASLTVAAKYAGTTGNHITIAVDQTDDTFDVITYFKANEVSRQNVSEISELLSNDWVNFSGTGAPAPTAGVPFSLDGGTNGTVASQNYAAYFSIIKEYKPWNVMAMPDSDDSLPPLVESLVRNMRDDLGKKVQAVVLDYTDINYEGIISVDQGYKTATEEITPAMFTAYVAGITAGAAINESNTYRQVAGAVQIINPKDSSDIPQLLKSGCFLLANRQDGAVVVEQDINTFTAFASDKGYEFSKNRVIRTIDGYNNDIRILFENSYIGKVDNNEIGRNIFKADVISYLLKLQSMGAIQQFNSSEDILITAGEKIDEVILDLWIMPVDAMEKLYNRVYLRQIA